MTTPKTEKVYIRNEEEAKAYLTANGKHHTWVEAIGDDEHGWVVDGLGGVDGWYISEKRVNGSGSYALIAGCTRCGGCGRHSHNGEHDICYGCGGDGGRHWVSAIGVAKDLRRKELAQLARIRKAEKKIQNQLDGQRNWCEANTEFGRVTFDEKAELELEQKREKHSHLSHVGELKVRQEWEGMTLVSQSKKFESFYGEGMVRIFTFATAEGNPVIWSSKADALEEFNVDALFCFRATPVKHKEFNGKPQTQVNRLANLKNMEVE